MENREQTERESFWVGETPVRVAYAPDAEPLRSVLRSHFLARKEASYAPQNDA